MPQLKITILLSISLLSADSLLAVSLNGQNSISGKISISGKYADKAKVKDVVVYFQPVKGSNPIPLQNAHQVLMKNKAYHPRVSVIPTGSELKITNKDSILHNAFSPSRSNKFDLGLYGKDKEKTHFLNTEGVVRIFCNVHYHMVAYVLVLDTPHYTLTDENGFFKLEELPQGKGKLIFWHERARRVVRTIEVSDNKMERMNIDIPITKRRIPAHKKKSGKSYRSKRRSRRY